jgi:uncharacterized protein YndB with AHSA1/START domain
MTSPKPTGRLEKSETGAKLMLERTFEGTAEDVWQSLTDPARTARWFGPWEGEGGVGNTIRVQMVFEEGKPWCNVRIDACEPPRRLGFYMKDDYGEWNLDLSLSSTGDTTKLTFVQALKDPKEAENTGPGWEYYLDMLVASRTGAPLAPFSDYYPAQKEYYAAEAGRIDVR